MTALETFIATHQSLSYLVVFAGILFIEADLFFLTAAIFADQGHLKWSILLPLAFTAVLSVDLALYYLGKYSKASRVGAWISARFERYRNSWFDGNFLSRYPKFIFFTKFLYYVNRLMPFLAGWKGMELKNFLSAHLYADAVWLATVSIIGSVLGAVVNIVGPRWVLSRIWIFFLALALLFILGEYFAKRFFKKRLAEIKS